jgi:hypothetical protein
MAIIKFTNSKGSVKGILRYVMDMRKTEESLISGLKCVPESAAAEMENTKLSYSKTDGRQYVHIVQAFHPDDEINAEECHALGLLFAQRFKGFQAVVATHDNRDHLHNHIVLNSVNLDTGRKFHQSIRELDAVKEYSNELCREFGLTETPVRLDRSSIKQGEFEAAMKAESWKFTLIKAIDEALASSATREDFIANMMCEGYGVVWKPTRKNITFTTPEGRKCRDNKLHDATYLKENLELIIRRREEYGFDPMMPEPEIGWLNHAKKGLGLPLDEPLTENVAPVSSPAAVSSETESRRKEKRERLKQLANQHPLPSELDAPMEIRSENQQVLETELSQGQERGMRYL